LTLPHPPRNVPIYSPMNASEPPPLPELPASSLSSRLLNILVAPGEAFDAIKSAPAQAANWVVPLVLATVASIVFVVVAFSQPVILDEVIKQQEDALDRQVAAGKMPAAQADKAREQMENMRPMMGTITKVFGSIGAAVVGAVMLFLTGFFLWAVARWAFHVNVPYLKWVEVAGLASLVMALGTVVTLFLVLLKGTLSTSLGPILFFPELKAGGPAQVFLQALNVFYLWWCAVVSAGLARLTGKSFGLAALWVIGFYLVITGLFVGVAAVRMG
jgi:hypothetical protein